MKQLGLAMQMYALDNGDELAREGYDADGHVWWNNWAQVRGRNNDSDDVWYNALPKAMGVRPAKAYLLDHESFYSRQNVLQCPAARFPSIASLPNDSIARFSIAMNSHLINYPNVPTIRQSQIVRPAKVVLFLDNLMEGEKKVCAAQDSSTLGQPAAWFDRFSIRHGGKGNLAFADGHVAAYSGPKVVAPDGGPNLETTEIEWYPFP